VSEPTKIISKPSDSKNFEAASREVGRIDSLVRGRSRRKAEYFRSRLKSKDNDFRLKSVR
jgi:hypothetical protein